MIHWITDHLGTASWEGAAGYQGIRFVDVRDLVDKGGNPATVLKSKIDEGVQLLRQGAKVVVCCDYGISRSNAVATGILAEHEGLALEEAVRRVIAITGEPAIRIEVLAAVRKALGAEVPHGGKPGSSRRQILVTGGSGFIGSSSVEQLRTSYEVIAPTRQEIDLARDAIHLDLLVKERGIDTVLHLANPRIFTTNASMGEALVMLKNVLDVCKENGLRLVYLSGWEIYSGYEGQELRADESLPPCPGGTYGQTKFLSEMLIEHYRTHHDIDCSVIRSSPVYGLGSNRPRFIWNFLEKAIRDEEIITHRYANGFPALDLLHVEDLCAAILVTVKGSVKGSINVGTGVATSTAEIARRIVDLVGSRSTIHHHEIDGNVANIVLDNRRAAETLGWQPRIRLSEGLGTIVTQVLARRKAPARPMATNCSGSRDD